MLLQVQAQRRGSVCPKQSTRLSGKGPWQLRCTPMANCTVLTGRRTLSACGLASSPRSKLLARCWLSHSHSAFAATTWRLAGRLRHFCLTTKIMRECLKLRWCAMRPKCEFLVLVSHMNEDCEVHAKHEKFVNPDKSKAGCAGVMKLSLKLCSSTCLKF